MAVGVDVLVGGGGGVGVGEAATIVGVFEGAIVGEISPVVSATGVSARGEGCDAGAVHEDNNRLVSKRRKKINRICQ